MQMQRAADQLQVLELQNGVGKLEAEWLLKATRIQRNQALDLEAVLLRGARKRDELELHKIEEVQRHQLRLRNLLAVRLPLHSCTSTRFGLGSSHDPESGHRLCRSCPTYTELRSLTWRCFWKFRPWLGSAFRSKNLVSASGQQDSVTVMCDDVPVPIAHSCLNLGRCLIIHARRLLRGRATSNKFKR